VKNILVIEDNEDNMDLIEAFLEDDYELTCTFNGKEGISSIKNQKPDLVLCDISMPIMDGEETIKAIRNEMNLNNLPVIALTAHAMKGDREKYIQMGFSDYISKPIDDDELVEKLNNFLGD